MKTSIRCNKRGIPYLCKNDIEKIAYMHLKRFDPQLLKLPVPMPIEEFLENYLELEMDYVDITPDASILGITVFDSGFITVYDSQNKCSRTIYEKEGTVVIENALLKPMQKSRLRFTYGHEAGHWILHRNVLKENSCTNEKENTYTEENVQNCSSKKRLRTDEDWMEWQANYLCSCLLMPQMTFRFAACKTLRKVGIKQEYVIAAGNCNKDFIRYMTDEMASVFDVSLEAAYIRLKGLNILR